MKVFYLLFILPINAAEICLSLPVHSTDATDMRRKQLTVPLQSNSCGGSTSCGYQALRNSIFISLAHQDTSKQEYYWDQLVSEESINTACLKWRNKIIKHRACKVAKDYIHDQLLHSLNIDCTEITVSPGTKAHLYYKYDQSKGLIIAKVPKELQRAHVVALANLFGEVAQAIVMDNQESSFCLTDTDVNDLLHIAIKRKIKAQGSDKDEYRALQTNFQLNIPYFKDIDINFVVQDDLSITDLSGTKVANSKEVPYGDWVQVEEIPLLLAYEREQGWLKDTSIPICIYGDEGMDEELDKLIQKFRTTEEDIITPILIYTGNQRSILTSGESEATYYARQTNSMSFGHFFTMVVIRKQGKVHFLIADSLGSNRLRHKQVTEIQCLLDGVPVPAEDSSYTRSALIALIVGAAGYGLYTSKKKKEVSPPPKDNITVDSKSE